MALLDNNPVPSTCGSGNLTAEFAVSLLNQGAPTMTAAQLAASVPASSVLLFAIAYTSDSGPVYSNGTSWVALSTSSSGSAPTFGASVTATLAASQNNYSPAGYVGGTTNRLLLAAASGGSTITGLAAATDGWALYMVNTSTTDSINLSHLSSSSSAANQFSCPQAVTDILAPLSSTLLTYVVNQWVAQ
jgi:hypothetical protein